MRAHGRSYVWSALSMESPIGNPDYVTLILLLSNLRLVVLSALALAGAVPQKFLTSALHTLIDLDKNDQRESTVEREDGIDR